MRFSVVVYSALAALTSVAPFSVPAEAEVRDGRLFDPGVTMTAPAEGAPAELARLGDMLGEWDLELGVERPDAEPLISRGVAKVTFMNRGHAILERTRIADFDGEGHPMATLTFLAVDANGIWTATEGNSWTESIGLASGGFADDDLVLYDALRPGGGPRLALLRRTYGFDGADRFAMQLERSMDQGASWSTVATRRYTRRAPEPGFFAVRDDLGVAAPDRPTEAAGFDFLLGEFDAAHWLRSPAGDRAWRSNATAVYALDGHAILEFDWHDLDPSLPDAATSLLRLYNRSMRRWESIFLTNRSNSALHFGGVREGERIVLHPFDAQTAGNNLSQWIFHDVRDDAYRWKGLTSTDRGARYPLYWGIDFVRKGVDPASVRAAQEIAATGSDGRSIFGDHYRPSRPAAPTVVLFHQAGGDARGEYGAVIERLLAEGFEVFAWDTRGGGDRFGTPNRTMAAQGHPEVGYCDAYPDLEAALDHAFIHGSGGPLYAIGSSFSAALVIRLGVEHGERLAGVAALSPASGRMEACAVEHWLPRLESVPVLAVRPDAEMEHESVTAQATLFRQHGIELFVAAGGVHGASTLDTERAEGDVEPTWTRLLAFLADPTAEPSSHGE